MTPPTEQSVPLWPLVVYFAVIIALVAVMLFLGHYLGEKHREHATVMPYESGMRPTGSARLLFPAEFYLVAMFFVIFDLETVFVVAWAVSARALGWAGYISIALFIGILLAALVYLWRLGALDWGTSAHQRAAQPIDEQERAHVADGE